MEFDNFYFIIALFLNGITGFSEAGLPLDVVKACHAIYNPKVLTTSCCPQINDFARMVGACLPNKKGAVTTCNQVKCIAKDYKVLSKNQIDFYKIHDLIDKLDKCDPETKKMNGVVKQYCVFGNYTSFPSQDWFCKPWKYLNCVAFAYNIACENTISTGNCKSIKANIDKCRPHADKYVEMLSNPEQCIGL